MHFSNRKKQARETFSRLRCERLFCSCVLWHWDFSYTCRLKIALQNRLFKFCFCLLFIVYFTYFPSHSIIWRGSDVKITYKRTSWGRCKNSFSANTCQKKMFESNQKFTEHLNKFSVVTFNDYVIHQNHTKLQSNENAFFSFCPGLIMQRSWHEPANVQKAFQGNEENRFFHIASGKERERSNICRDGE